MLYFTHRNVYKSVILLFHMVNQPLELEVNSIRSSYRPPVSWHVKRKLFTVLGQISDTLMDFGNKMNHLYMSNDTFYFLAYEEALKEINEIQRDIKDNGYNSFKEFWPTYIDFLDHYFTSVVDLSREANVPDENIFQDVSSLIAENYHELLWEHLHPRRPDFSK